MRTTAHSRSCANARDRIHAPPPPPDPPVVLLSLVALSLLQAVVWFFLSQPSSFICSAVVAYVRSKPDGEANVLRNVRAENKRSGFPPPADEEEAIGAHAFMYVAFVHHVLGSALLVLSYAWADEWLFRLGLSFEIGEGVQHLLQMAHAVIAPPGTKPISKMAKVIWIILIFHHSLGLLAGSVAYLYLASNPEVQILCALLLGAAVPAFVNLPLFPRGCLNSGSNARINSYLQVGSLAFMAYTRFVFFFPVCLRIAPVVFAPPSRRFRAC